MSGDDWLRRFTDIEDVDDDHEPAGPVPRRPPPDDRDGVRVVVDGSGAVVDVVVPPTWRRSIAPPALGETLLASANDAIVRSVHFEVGPPPARTGVDIEDAGGDPTSPVAQRLVAEILDLFGRFDADVSDYRARMRAAAVPLRAVGMNQRVTVTVSGRLVDSVEVDVHWAARSRHTEIGAEALSAFRSAQQAELNARAAVREPGSFARLRELGGDTRALCRGLGLTPGGTGK